MSALTEEQLTKTEILAELQHGPNTKFVRRRIGGGGGGGGR